MTDIDQRAVYAAEDQLTGWLDHAVAGTLRVDGREFRPETEPRFSDPEAAGRYVDQVLDHLRSTHKDYSGREQLPVRVRARSGRLKSVYEPTEHTIAVPPFEVGGRWALRGLVVLHELAHHLHAESDHGSGFRATFLRLLEDIGAPVLADLLQHAYAGHGLEQLTHSVDDGTLARIAKLLRQAEGTANEHERAAFLGKAQSLATTHSVALALARSHTSGHEQAEQPVAETYRIGPPGKRGLARYSRLLINVAGANDLQCTITHDSTAVTMHGFVGDITVTKALYESLLVQMVTDCEHYLASGERELTERWDPRRRAWVERPVATITARMAFYEAYAWRIHERLVSARAAVIDAVGAGDQPSLESSLESSHEPTESPASRSSATAIALRDKEVAVHDFFADALRRNDVRGTWRGDRRSAIASAPTAAGEGDRAATRAQLGGSKALDAAG